MNPFNSMVPSPITGHLAPLAWLCLFAGAACTARQGNVAEARPAIQSSRPTAVAALSVTKPTLAPAPPRNPFVGAGLFRDPQYAKKVESTRVSSEQQREWLDTVKERPTALWLDNIAALEKVPTWLEDAERDGKENGAPVVPVFVVYNLPNRDCAAKSSNGELKIEEDGERRYREDYIDRLAALFQAHPEQPAVAIIEPDSLPNLVSNLGVERCAVSAQVYKHSVAYAIAKLSLPHVSLYLDAAHGGWLGWEANRRRTVAIFKEVLDMAGGPERIRGFATNVSNVNPLTGTDNNRLESTNPTPNEHLYVSAFAETLAQAGIHNMGFIIDTSRNGRSGIRTVWGNWCNIRGAGLGEPPRVAPRPLVDAYFWVKPPGESDGTADPNAARFDENCASADATPGAPEAGEWFSSYFVELMKNANPPL